MSEMDVDDSQPAREERTFADALCAAQRDAMVEDPDILLLGQDIQAGFPFGATRGLVQEFGPDRVRNTPISEAGTMGCGIGAAMMGVRAVVEVDFAGFGLLGMDQLVNNAAKLRYMSDGQLRVPLVIRMGQGPLGAFGAQHSQSLHAWLASVPGLAVVVPSSPQDAYSLMRWALLQEDPVVVAEDLRLYQKRGLVERVAPAWPTPPKAVVLHPGTDVTVVGYGYGVHVATEAAELLAVEGISVEVVQLTSLAPLDVEAVIGSVFKTRRALCLGDDAGPFGTAAVLAATVWSECQEQLLSPVAQLGARPVPVPFATPLERAVYPTSAAVVDAVHRLQTWEGVRA